MGCISHVYLCPCVIYPPPLYILPPFAFIHSLYTFLLPFPLYIIYTSLVHLPSLSFIHCLYIVPPFAFIHPPYTFLLPFLLCILYTSLVHSLPFRLYIIYTCPPLPFIHPLYIPRTFRLYIAIYTSIIHPFSQVPSVYTSIIHPSYILSPSVYTLFIHPPSASIYTFIMHPFSQVPSIYNPIYIPYTSSPLPFIHFLYIRFPLYALCTSYIPPLPCCYISYITCPPLVRLYNTPLISPTLYIHVTLADSSAPPRHPNSIYNLSATYQDDIPR